MLRIFRPTHLRLLRLRLPFSQKKTVQVKQEVPEDDEVIELPNKPIQHEEVVLEEKKEELTSEERELIASHRIHAGFNQILDRPADANLQHELILFKKEYSRNKKQLRAAILFEQILQSETSIPIYDTNGIPFYQSLYIMKFMAFIGFTTFCITIWLSQASQYRLILNRTQKGKFIKFFAYLQTSFFVYYFLRKHRKLQRFYVQKVVYHTKTETFTFLQRSYLGKPQEIELSRYKLMYTESPFLNDMGVNYFQINTLQKFGISYKQSWLKQDLFSHLIAQRIKL